MRVAAGGNVGIGTANPLATTHVVNSGTQGAFVGLVGHENNIGLRVENNVNGNAVIQHFTAKNASGASRDAIMGINPIGTSGNGLFILARDNASDFLMDLTSGHIGLGTDPSPTIRINMADPAGASENPIARVSNISPVAAGNKAIIGFNAYNGGGSTWGIGSEQQSTSAFDSSFNFLYSGGSSYIKLVTIKPSAPSTGASAFFGINNPNPTSALDVIGNAKVSGTTTMSNGYTAGGLATHNGNIQLNGLLTANSTAAVVQSMTSSAATLAGGVIQLRKAAAAVSGDVWMNFIANGSTVGTITSNTATSIAYNTTSDVRLKENIKPTHFGIKDVMNIQVSDYNYKADSGKTPQTGFIAQQLHTVFPVAVTKGGEDAGKNPWAVDYGKVTPLLVKAIQDQQKQIDELKAQNAKLTAAVDNATDMENKYAQLLQQVKEMQVVLGVKKIQNSIVASNENTATQVEK